MTTTDEKRRHVQQGLSLTHCILCILRLRYLPCQRERVPCAMGQALADERISLDVLLGRILTGVGSAECSFPRFQFGFQRGRQNDGGGGTTTQEADEGASRRVPIDLYRAARAELAMNRDRTLEHSRTELHPCFPRTLFGSPDKKIGVRCRRVQVDQDMLLQSPIYCYARHYSKIRSFFRRVCQVARPTSGFRSRILVTSAGALAYGRVRLEYCRAYEPTADPLVLWAVGLFKRKSSKQEDADVLKAKDAKEKVKWSKRPASEFNRDDEGQCVSRARRDCKPGGQGQLRCQRTGTRLVLLATAGLCNIDACADSPR